MFSKKVIRKVSYSGMKLKVESEQEAELLKKVNIFTSYFFLNVQIF